MRLLAAVLIGSVVTWARSASAADEERLPAYRLPDRPALRLAAATLEVTLADGRADRPTKLFIEDAAPDDKYDPLRVSREELEATLAQRLRPSLELGSAPIVFRVIVREISEDSKRERTRVTLGVVAATTADRKLAATSATTELAGSGGSMSRGERERLQAGILDAAERAVLREPFLRAVNAALASPKTAESAREVPPAVQAWSMTSDEATSAAHVLGLNLDAGRAYAVGVRYLHEHFMTSAGVFWAGYGVEARIFSENFDSVDAGGGLAIGRVGFGAEQAISLEAGVGVAGADRARPFGRVGLGYGFYYFELAGGFEFPFAPSERPAWMPALTGGLRVNIPVNVHAVQITCNSPLPCSPSHVFPRMNTGDPTKADDAHR